MLVTVTVVAGTLAPVLSVIRPLIVPLMACDCPRAKLARPKTRSPAVRVTRQSPCVRFLVIFGAEPFLALKSIHAHDQLAICLDGGMHTPSDCIRSRTVMQLKYLF